ncbi:Core-2/I-branching beta-1,6-N-acetylglucosaminyltransferase family protein [Striga asiatica]|uniref:Core-2/I-branching beta-1,6-N-acetylglucosaminyltransferase family protein n=1 Tax=Striga asiatica TaxID=4170 RepID=A0A5A7RA74_STRAF|nr:Core-2/I-branching beta-1,6-N-acetylglucosaminyltransferase family protein [Striga asiatica]
MKRSHINRKSSLPIAFFSISAVILISILVLSDHKPSGSPFPGSDPTDPILPDPPRFAYFISGTSGDGRRLRRLLQALYHPRNYYLLHLDWVASDDERLELARFAKSEAAVRSFGNVMVMGKGDLITPKGPTAVASTLHAVAILLKQAESWDWFVNLGASDYPLMPQDDLLHIFSYLPRDLNFIEHTSEFGWKEHQRVRPIAIDPALYHPKISGLFWAKEKRSVPVSFKLFTGSAWVVLSRPFLEFSIWGWDNLPRTLLMYYTNFLSSPEGYFHTVMCNHKHFQKTAVNHNLHYVRWENPQNEVPENLTLKHFDDMFHSGAPFAHKIPENDSVLDRIDKEILKRGDGRFVPGGWCLGRNGRKTDPCAVFGSSDVVRPSLSSRRMENLVAWLLDAENFRPRQCK